MNDFNQKPVTAEARVLVHQVVDRLLDYNPMRTTQETTGNKPTFSVDIDGFNAQIRVSIIKDGFPVLGERLKDVKYYSAYLCEDESNSADGIKESLGEILTRMEEVYNKWQEQKGNKYEDKQN